MDKITIHKSNKLIKCFTNYNLQTMKLFNSLYYLIQKNYNNSDSVNKKELSVNYKILIDLMGYKKNKSHSLNDTIHNNYKSLLTASMINDTQITLFDSINIMKNHYGYFLNICISNDFLDILKEKNHWSKIDISINKIISSVFQYKLYEFLKSYNNIKRSLYV